MDNVVILKNKIDDMFFDAVDGCKLMQYYKTPISSRNVVLRVIRSFNIPLLPLFYGEWHKHTNDYQYFILFDMGYSKQITKSIKKNNKRCKIIFYFWNKITEKNNEVFQDENIDEIWTFNSFDAKKYNLYYNPQFYAKSSLELSKSIDFDVIFLGRAKDRKQTILTIQKRLDELSTRTNFMIVEKDSDVIDYHTYLSLLMRSKCILEITSNDEMGLTLRCMESLFYEKKLITTNKNVVKYDFYNKDNIYILDLNSDCSNILEFINSPYKRIELKIIEQYEFKNWLRRLIESNNRGEIEI